MNNSNNQTARAAYQRAKEILYDSWIGTFMNDGKPNPEGRCRDYVESRKCSQSTLRLEVGLTAVGTNFKFAVTPNVANSSNVVFLTEQRLEMQDTLIANEYAVQIAQTAGNNDVNFQPRSYPNTQDFAAADVALLNNIFYGNGSLRWTCNNDVIAPYRPLRQNYYAGQTQQTAALGAGSPQDQFRGAEDGFITMEPNIWLIGSKGYIPEIVLKTAMTGLGANIRAILWLNGILAQNSTSVS